MTEVPYDENGDRLIFVDPDGWWSYYVKRDGCVEIRRFHNQPFINNPTPTLDTEDVDFMHICDLDEFVLRLQALQEAIEKWEEKQ